MPVVDNDAVVRDRAYDLWEKAGRPSGMEHQHWAEARRQIERETASALPIAVELQVVAAGEIPGDMDGHGREFELLRRALYAPEPFSCELFGDECPAVDHPIILQRAA